MLKEVKEEQNPIYLPGWFGFAALCDFYRINWHCDLMVLFLHSNILEGNIQW